MMHPLLTFQGQFSDLLNVVDDSGSLKGLEAYRAPNILGLIIHHE